MPRKGRSNEEIVHALHQVDSGEKVAEVCRRLGVSEQKFHRWKKQFAGLGVAEVRELRSLRAPACCNDGAGLQRSPSIMALSLSVGRWTPGHKRTMSSSISFVRRSPWRMRSSRASMASCANRSIR